MWLDKLLILMNKRCIFCVSFSWRHCVSSILQDYLVIHHHKCIEVCKTFPSTRMISCLSKVHLVQLWHLFEVLGNLCNVAVRHCCELGANKRLQAVTTYCDNCPFQGWYIDYACTFLIRSLIGTFSLLDSFTLFYCLELFWCLKLYNASYGIKQKSYCLEPILAIVGCVQLFTVFDMQFLVSKEMDHKNYHASKLATEWM